MFSHILNTAKPIDWTKIKQPILTVVIDTEEEFDWSKEHNRNARHVENIKSQYLAQNIYNKYKIKPTYVIDSAVVESDMAVGILKEWLQDDLCEIGTHLHPWLEKPYGESLSAYNSYAGNLPYDLEYSKLSRLTDGITNAFDKRPLTYKAGRYGLGERSVNILSKLGYKVDLSVVQGTNFSQDGGPDYRDFSTHGMWLKGEEGDILELPNSRGYRGALAHYGHIVYPNVAGATGMRAIIAAVMSKSRMLSRIPITTEGMKIEDIERATFNLVQSGHKHVHFSYHSSSLMIGGSPYVQNSDDLNNFVSNIERYVDYFLHELGGCHQPPMALYDQLKKSDANNPK